ncbi:hypothetical protein [Acinetobacter sp.]|uniref:hypothetical protein n=1 Tax=Acinetobacter sp. TaxID=472 RepID=UPI00281EB8C4|nr:hypothetical protein [Acinetobacter sp.]MDR0235131.1 hypothetical protein [Acinetobacter sp.]
MLKPKISFKIKKWTCKHCGLLKEVSKWRIKVGESVFFNISYMNKNYENLNKTITGIVIDRQNKFLTVLDQNSNQTYFIDQNKVHLTNSPALFLYNMYGSCLCKHNNN